MHQAAPALVVLNAQASLGDVLVPSVGWEEAK
jgi:hypothetical protein